MITGRLLRDAELKEGAVTRYAAWIPELIEREEVFRDVEYLLTVGRGDIYSDTYELLKGVQKAGN